MKPALCFLKPKAVNSNTKPILLSILGKICRPFLSINWGFNLWLIASKRSFTYKFWKISHENCYSWERSLCDIPGTWAKMQENDRCQIHLVKPNRETKCLVHSSVILTLEIMMQRGRYRMPSCESSWKCDDYLARIPWYALNGLSESLAWIVI